MMAPMPSTFMSRLRVRSPLIFVALSGEMPAGDMAGFVRDDADHLVGCLGVDESAGIHEDAVAVEHEGVEGLVLRMRTLTFCPPRPAASRIGPA